METKEKVKRPKPEFKEELVATVPTKDGGEIRFQVLEADGKHYGDIRKYEEWGEVKGKRPKKGLDAFSPERYQKFLEAAVKLGERLAKKA